MLWLVARVPPRLDLLVVDGTGSTAPEGGLPLAVAAADEDGSTDNHYADDTQDHREDDDEVPMLGRHWPCGVGHGRL